MTCSKHDSVKKQLRDHNTDVAGGHLQPLDVSFTKPFKENVRVMWSEWIAGDEQKEFTKVIKPSITLWCNWILKSWEQIDPAMVVKSLKKCFISNNLEQKMIFCDTDAFPDISENDDECA